MGKSIFFRVVLFLVLIGALVALGGFAFNAGVARGVALSANAPAGQTNVAPYPVYGMPYGMHYGFHMFGFFGLLIPLFLIFIIMGSVRAMFWHRHFGYGPWGHHMHAMGENDLPPMFAEWHKRAHEKAQETPADK